MVNIIKKQVQKYKGKLRALKLVYTINNFLNRDKLIHNRALYKELGIKKSIYSPLGKQDIEGVNLPGPWLDQDDAFQQLSQNDKFKALEPDMQENIKQFMEDGFMILPGFYKQSEVDEFNTEIDQLIESKTLDFNYTGKKIMESYKVSEKVDQAFFRNKKILEIFSFILGKEIIPFHTINFIEGSEQKAHSDSIHMSTVPEGFMIAAWVALEKTDLENGPLFYYPGSHKMQYVSCLDYNSGNSKFLIGDESYMHYEEHVSQLIKSGALKKEYFLAAPGDVLIWHANLLHGGDPISKKGRTRKSMVAHFFAKDVLCYHEISQRPALLDVR